MNCPKCGSIQISSNELGIEPERIVHGAHVLHRLGLPVAAFGALAGALGVKIVNGLRHSWSCNACGHHFS